jgi:hypothetical protein
MVRDEEDVLAGGVKTKHKADPFRMVKAAHPQSGYIQEVKVDRHSPMKEDEFRILGWLIVDDYKTPEQRAWFEAECKKRRDAHENKERQDVLKSPRGREAIIQAEVAKDAARAALAAVAAVSEERSGRPPKEK